MIPVTRRTKVVGFGTGLVLAGLVFIYNFGLGSLFHSPFFGDYRLSDPLTVEQLPSSFFEGTGPEIGLVRLGQRPNLSLKDFRQIGGWRQGQSQLFAGREICVLGQPFQDFWVFKGVQVFGIHWSLLQLPQESREDIGNIAGYPEANGRIEKCQSIVKPWDKY